jgi:hypothetical protein
MISSLPSNLQKSLNHRISSNSNINNNIDDEVEDLAMKVFHNRGAAEKSGEMGLNMSGRSYLLIS